MLIEQSSHLDNGMVAPAAAVSIINEQGFGESWARAGAIAIAISNKRSKLADLIMGMIEYGKVRFSRKGSCVTNRSFQIMVFRKNTDGCV